MVMLLWTEHEVTTLAVAHANEMLEPKLPLFATVNVTVQPLVWIWRFGS
jgi:hypothetical protein